MNHSHLEEYFYFFRKNIIGIDDTIKGLNQHEMQLVYADWTASGRCYAPIEDRIQKQLLPLVANTHTETNTTGSAMTNAYHQAKEIIKKHVGANEHDVIINIGSGMTGVINKFQRILGVKCQHTACASNAEHSTHEPVVFITHMEHHSNHTSWLETTATVEVIKPTDDGLVDLEDLKNLLTKYQHRAIKIASVTACSNVTGIVTPYHQIAQIMHDAGGWCFVDFACSAPYVDINMHPKNENEHLDAVFFSPHKFLGGPGSSGVLVFNKKLYSRAVPDHPGGGTVDFTNPWGKHMYIADIESREDGGTPAFLQTIRAALAMRLKEQMGVKNILDREHELLEIIWPKLQAIPNLHILASQHKERLGVISFYIEGLHHNLGVRLLNDRFGIQTRGGCSCAGTYGHYLLNIDFENSEKIAGNINHGDYSLRPGWIRASIHPTMTNAEANFLADSIAAMAANFEAWSRDYEFNASKNILKHKSGELDAEVKAKVYHVFADHLI